MSTVTILTASMTGTAELVADEIEEFLMAEGIECSVQPMDDVGIGDLQSLKSLIVCTSTTGTGDIPDNGVSLFEELDSGNVMLPKLRVAIFGLGDSTYHETFNFGGAKFEKAFTKCGAILIGDRLAHDASVDPAPEELAQDWCRSIIEDLTSDT